MEQDEELLELKDQVAKATRILFEMGLERRGIVMESFFDTMASLSLEKCGRGNRQCYLSRARGKDADPCKPDRNSGAPGRGLLQNVCSKRLFCAGPGCLSLFRVAPWIVAQEKWVILPYLQPRSAPINILLASKIEGPVVAVRAG